MPSDDVYRPVPGPGYAIVDCGREYERKNAMAKRCDECRKNGSFKTELQTVPTEPARLIPAGKVRIEHTDIPYYIEGRL